jgi:amino acid permease
MSNAAQSYIPGVCNIGKREILRRRAVGIAALVFAFVSGFTLLMSDGISQSARWAIFFPLFVSAIGFIQARNRFCLAYGSKKSDRRKALVILVQAALAAAAITVLFTLLP